jgi:hypothetical protein
MLSYYFMAALDQWKREEKLRVVGKKWHSSDIGSWRKSSDSVAADQLEHINNYNTDRQSITYESCCCTIWLTVHNSALHSADWTGFDPQQRQRIFPVASVSRKPLRSTQPPSQWVQRYFPTVKRGQGKMLTTHSHLLPRSKSLPLGVCIAAAGQLYFILQYKQNKKTKVSILTSINALNSLHQTFLIHNYQHSDPCTPRAVGLWVGLTKLPAHLTHTGHCTITRRNISFRNSHIPLLGDLCTDHVAKCMTLSIQMQQFQPLLLTTVGIYSSPNVFWPSRVSSVVYCYILGSIAYNNLAITIKI